MSAGNHHQASSSIRRYAGEVSVEKPAQVNSRPTSAATATYARGGGSGGVTSAQQARATIESRVVSA